jgi:hypothetical protein
LADASSNAEVKRQAQWRSCYPNFFDWVEDPAAIRAITPAKTLLVTATVSRMR